VFCDWIVLDARVLCGQGGVVMNWTSFVLGFTVGVLSALQLSVWRSLVAYSKVLRDTHQNLKKAVDNLQ
jgi:hypothetical protein